MLLHSSELTPHAQRSIAAIHVLVAEQTQAWNRNDAAGWVKDFTDDANYINVRGDVVKGRTAIEDVYAFLFAGPFKASYCTVAIDTITYPAPTVAVVETTTELTKFEGLPPGLIETVPGLLRTRLKFVLSEREGKWEIFAAQNTAVSPQPMPVN